MNNDQQTLGKAVLSGRLNAIIRRLDKARDAYETSPKNKTLENGKTAFQELREGAAAAQAELEELYRDLQANLEQETTLGREYNKETFDATLRTVRQKVLERFKNFPMAAAMLELFIMLLETDLTLAAHFFNLRKQAGVEDRQGPNGQFYNLDGDPKNKG